MLTPDLIAEIEAALENYEEALESFFDRDDCVAGAAWLMSDTLKAILENHSN